jgi:hypothetical protein
MEVTKEDATRIVDLGLGPVLVEHGFRQSPNHLTFKRKVAEGEQRIGIHLAINPPYARGQIHFLPDFRLILPHVGEVLERIAVGPNYYGDRTNDIAIYEQVHMIAGGKAKADWYLASPSQTRDFAVQQRAFFSEWVIPFADDYQDAAAYVDGHLRRDPRLVVSLWRIPMVAAAMVVLGRKREARELISSMADEIRADGGSWDGLLDALSRE